MIPDVTKASLLMELDWKLVKLCDAYSELDRITKGKSYKNGDVDVRPLLVEIVRLVNGCYAILMLVSGKFTVKGSTKARKLLEKSVVEYLMKTKKEQTGKE